MKILRFREKVFFSFIKFQFTMKTGSFCIQLVNCIGLLSNILLHAPKILSNGF